MKLIFPLVLGLPSLCIPLISRYSESPLPRKLQNSLNQVSTDLNTFIPSNDDPVLSELQMGQLAGSLEGGRNDGRVQLMNNYDLQFTDDIRVIIQNVLLYRKHFNQSKAVFQTSAHKAYFWGSTYQSESSDPRSGRPINLLLANNEVTNVPRRLTDSFSNPSTLSMHDHTRQTLLGVMNEKE